MFSNDTDQNVFSSFEYHIETLISVQFKRKCKIIVKKMDKTEIF